MSHFCGAVARARAAQALAQRAVSAGGVLDAGRSLQQEEDIYANPPSLAKTLFGGKEDPSVREYEGSAFGPNQVRPAAGRRVRAMRCDS